jgi:hypothetical protein
VENGHSLAAPKPTGWRDPKRVLLAIAIFSVFAVIVGGAYAYLHRHDTICKDGRAPISQRAYGVGQVQYLCRDGELVTKP